MPVPKVIDFGIAKAIRQRLTEKTVFTRNGVLVGSPVHEPRAGRHAGGRGRHDDRHLLARRDAVRVAGGCAAVRCRAIATGRLRRDLRILRGDQAGRPSQRVTALGVGPRAWPPDATRRCPRCSVSCAANWTRLSSRHLRKPDPSLRVGVGVRGDVDGHLSDEPVLASPPSAVYQLRKSFRSTGPRWPARRLWSWPCWPGLPWRPRCKSGPSGHASKPSDSAPLHRADGACANMYSRSKTSRAETERQRARRGRAARPGAACPERRRGSAGRGGRPELFREHRRGRPAVAFQPTHRSEETARRGAASAPRVGVAVSLRRKRSEPGDNWKRRWSGDVNLVHARRVEARMGGRPGRPPQRRPADTPAARRCPPPIRRITDRSVVAVSADGSKYVTAAWTLPVSRVVYLPVARKPRRACAREGRSRPRERNGHRGDDSGLSDRANAPVGPATAASGSAHAQRHRRGVWRHDLASGPADLRRLGASRPSVQTVQIRGRDRYGRSIRP